MKILNDDFAERSKDLKDLQNIFHIILINLKLCWRLMGKFFGISVFTMCWPIFRMWYELTFSIHALDDS